MKLFLFLSVLMSCISVFGDDNHEVFKVKKISNVKLVCHSDVDLICVRLGYKKAIEKKCYRPISVRMVPRGAVTTIESQAIYRYQVARTYEQILSMCNEDIYCVLHNLDQMDSLVPERMGKKTKVLKKITCSEKIER